MSETITVSAVVIRDAEGRVLTVRKRGTSAFMFPGGKPEQGESAPRTAVREVAEELGIELREDELGLLGEFTTAAANETDCRVHATVFTHPYVEVHAPRAEIDEVAWVDPHASDVQLAPLLKDAVLPQLDPS